MKETQNAQVPWEHSALRGRFYFNPAAPPVPSAGPAPQSSTRPQLSDAAQAWTVAERSTDPAVLEAFIKHYGDTFYGTMARSRLAEMKRQQVAVAEPPPAAKSSAAIIATSPSVGMKIDGDDMGYVRITKIGEEAYDGLKKAIADIRSAVPANRLIGYVIDLRNNPGGDFSGAILVADALLERGEIVSEQKGNPEDTARWNARPGDLTSGKPLIILINSRSGTETKIVAGALQDHKRATIIGTKAASQWNASRSSYFTPAGRRIDTGISPDIEVLQDEVPSDPKSDQTLNLAFDLMRGIQRNAAFPPNPGLPTAPGARR